MRELPSQDCFLEEKEFLWIDWERIRRCPHEEKQKLLPYIERLQKLQQRTRIIGVLRALLRELKQTDDPLERLGMQMILNSDFDKAPSVLAHFISSTANLTDADYLRYVIFYSYLCSAIGNKIPVLWKSSCGHTSASSLSSRSLITLVIWRSGRRRLSRRSWKSK